MFYSYYYSFSSTGSPMYRKYICFFIDAHCTSNAVYTNNMLTSQVYALIVGGAKSTRTPRHIIITKHPWLNLILCIHAIRTKCTACPKLVNRPSSQLKVSRADGFSNHLHVTLIALLHQIVVIGRHCMLVFPPQIWVEA